MRSGHCNRSTTSTYVLRWGAGSRRPRRQQSGVPGLLLLCPPAVASVVSFTRALIPHTRARLSSRFTSQRPQLLTPSPNTGSQRVNSGTRMLRAEQRAGRGLRLPPGEGGGLVYPPLLIQYMTASSMSYGRSVAWKKAEYCWAQAITLSTLTISTA